MNLGTALVPDEYIHTTFYWVGWSLTIVSILFDT